MTLTPTAQHEAAHAVMAVLANVPFVYVTIEPGEVDGVITGGHLKPMHHRLAGCDTVEPRLYSGGRDRPFSVLQPDDRRDH
jgi:hypothetical protein